MGLQVPAAQHRLLLPRLHGFRTGLEDEQLACEAIFCPLDVHRRGGATLSAVVTLDLAGPAGQGEALVIAEGEAVALGFRHGLVCHGYPRFPIHHPDRLAAQSLAEDRRKALLKRWLKNQHLIGVNGALHNVFTEAVGGGEQHRVAEACLGVDAEHHPGAGQIGAHHALHTDRKGDLEVIKTIELAVGDGPVGEQRRVATPAGLQQGSFALNIEEGLLLASEAGIGQVFGGGAGAHCHGWQNAIWCCQLSIGGQDRFA